jgi:hypothetical protein
MPTLSDVRKLVRGSTPNDWHKIEDEGPTYRNRFGYSKGPGSKWRLEEDSHSTILVYTPEVDLTIAYGMYYHLRQGDEPDFEWSRAFASKSVRIGFADIFWRGSLVDRIDYAIVDDQQGIVPMGGGHDGLQVTSFEVDATRLLHDVKGYVNQFDYYFGRVPFRVTR